MCNTNGHYQGKQRLSYVSRCNVLSAKYLLSKKAIDLINFTRKSHPNWNIASFECSQSFCKFWFQ